MSNKLDNEKIRDSVSNFYKAVANNETHTDGDKEELSKSLGYSQEELEWVPEEANAGLGCGNPQIKAKAQPGEVVVDLGCGKGMDVFIAAKKVGENGHVIGVDMTPEMIKTARKIAKGRGFENVEFRLGEIEHLPIADNSVDLVISNCVINLSPEKEQVYREIYRVLKKGGRIGISDTSIIQELPDFILSNPKMYGTCVAGAITKDEKTRILEEVGFNNIDIEEKKVSHEYAKKWGIDEIDLTEYVASSIAVAYK